MTQSEACHQLDQWLLVPVNYDEALELLVEIRGAERFEYYVSKVADAEFKSNSEVLADVESFAAAQYGKYTALNEKLKAVSGGKIQSARYSHQSEDILDAVEREQNGIVDPDKKLKLNYSSFVQKHMKRGHKGSIRTKDIDEGDIMGDSLHLDPLPARMDAFYCGNCNCAMEERTKKGDMTCGGIALCVMLFFIFFPLCVLPILFMRKEEKYYVCPHCGRVHSLK